MIVALIDERGRSSRVTDEAVLRDGQALADQVIRIREELAPSMRDGDNGGVISALLTVAHDMTEAGAARD